MDDELNGVFEGDTEPESESVPGGAPFDAPPRGSHAPHPAPAPTRVPQWCAGAGLEEAVVQALAGFEVLDRELELGSGAEIDLVGSDSRGRLVLVCVVEAAGEVSDELVLATLDLVAEARGSVELLVSHVGGAARADLAPQLALVGGDFPAECTRRLAPLLASGDVMLFETRDLSSRRGRTTYLVPLEPEHGARLPRVDTLLGFLGGLPADLRAIADVAVSRLDRVDESVERTAIPGGLEWRSPDGVLCSLQLHAGQLEVSLPGRPPERLVRPADVEGVVESVLGRFIDQYGGGARALDEFPPMELIPHRDDAPILTPEELEAFRQ